MSFRLFVYHCTAWGSAAALLGWVVGRLIGPDPTLGGMTLEGLILGSFVALGLALPDALAGAARDTAGLLVRLPFALLLGAAGGALGGFVGPWLAQLAETPWLLVVGWGLGGVLIGAAPSAFDYLGAMLRSEDRRGAKRKLINGLVGGAVGGLAGGAAFVLLFTAWASLFQDPLSWQLWSPGASGFAALGACLGLCVSVAQVLFRDAWLRVEAGTRPGRDFLLTRPRISIGRSRSCDVALSSDAAVEKVHARIRREGDRWLVLDAGTPSGTLVNGQRIADATTLSPGDRIQVGGSVLTFAARKRAPAAAVEA